MTRPEFITAGRQPRPVRVERKRRLRRRAWSRGDVHAIGTAAVADALCPMGGVLTGADVARILGRRPEAGIPVAADASAAVEKRDVGRGTSIPATTIEGAKINAAPLGCAPPTATEAEILPDLSTAGALLDDIRRLIRPATGSFGRDLWGVVL